MARNLKDDAAASSPPVKYALVIDGKALLYALSPMLRDLFLQVRHPGPFGPGHPNLSLK